MPEADPSLGGYTLARIPRRDPQTALSTKGVGHVGAGGGCELEQGGGDGGPAGVVVIGGEMVALGQGDFGADGD